jgi:hypothetical protein
MGSRRKGLRLAGSVPTQMQGFACSRFRLKSPWIVLAVIAVAALLFGFLVFGGANMGN